MPSKVQEIEMRYSKPLADVLRELYAQTKSQRAVAKKLEVSQGTVSLWMKSLGLRISENRELEGDHAA